MTTAELKKIIEDATQTFGMYWKNGGAEYEGRLTEFTDAEHHHLVISVNINNGPSIQIFKRDIPYKDNREDSLGLLYKLAVNEIMVAGINGMYQSTCEMHRKDQSGMLQYLRSDTIAHMFPKTLSDVFKQ